MAIYIIEYGHANPKPNNILSQLELKKYNSFKTESGRDEFLLGRYSAKQAYVQLTQKGNFKDIEIKNGIFEQPFFAHNPEFDVSIAHTKGIGGAVVFDKALSMGFDIEIVDKSKIDALQVATETKEIAEIDLENEIALTIAWCLKEALSKAIRTGFAIPLEFLETEDFIETEGENVFKCRFKNFTQYKGITQTNENYVTALAYPGQLTVGDF